MLSLHPFSHKAARLGVAACSVVAAAACGDNNISGLSTIDPSLSRVASFDQLKESIRNPKSAAMPKLYPESLSDQDVESIAVYLETLR